MYVKAVHDDTIGTHSFSSDVRFFKRSSEYPVIMLFVNHAVPVQKGSLIFPVSLFKIPAFIIVNDALDEHPNLYMQHFQ